MGTEQTVTTHCHTQARRVTMQCHREYLEGHSIRITRQIITQNIEPLIVLRLSHNTQNAANVL